VRSFDNPSFELVATEGAPYAWAQLMATTPPLTGSTPSPSR